MIWQSIFFLVFLPLLFSPVLLVINKQKAKEMLTLFIMFTALVFSVLVFINSPSALVLKIMGNYSIVLGVNKLSRFTMIFVNLFCFFTVLYSVGSKQVRSSRAFLAYLLALLAFSNLVCLSLDFISLIFSWGACLALLYGLLSLGSGLSANKAFSIVGFGDFCLLLGVSLYVYLTGTAIMPIEPRVLLNSPASWLAFGLMLSGAFAKAGCAPFHTWIPDAAESAPIPVMAILPASLDKLLGIYLLARICTDFFVLNNIAFAILLIIGSITIMFAVMLALAQHDLRKLLSFHAISQVGYMVIGFGTGNMLGIAAAVFHMLNNAIYKSGLFFAGGAAAEKKDTFELDKLGGLAAIMPLTFICGLVFALSISGVPPFNGFASKWMLYQSTLIGISAATNPFMRGLLTFSLVAAMFGSVLTLASFVKFIHAIFLGQDHSPEKKVSGEPALNILVPLIMLSGLCLILGVLPNLFIKVVIEPWLGSRVLFNGTWNSILTFVLLAAGLILGFIFWKVGLAGKKSREDDLFIGGEDPKSFNPSFPATEFYRTFQQLPAVNAIFKFIGKESLDFYNILSSAINKTALFTAKLFNRDRQV
ncbi:MAG: complex I subunit 5 family protein [Candidatus Omnitrophica bacterium]|nr:complex I subunit 5 family protein [Candidatus Omnitrophota bacterium]